METLRNTENHYGTTEKSPLEARINQVNISLNAKEKFTILQKAEKANLTITEFMRNSSLNKKIIVEQSSRPDFLTRNELRRIGNNLNQIAKTLHQRGQIVPNALTEELEKLDKLFEWWLGDGSKNNENW